MGFQEALNILRKYIDEIVTEKEFNFTSKEEKEIYINEIIAYFIVSFYGKTPTESTTDYVKNYTEKKLLNADKNIKENDPNFNNDNCVKRVQRSTKKYLKARYGFYKMLSNSLPNLSNHVKDYIKYYENTIDKNNKKRFDRANMVFLNQIATPQKKTIGEKQVKTQGLISLLFKNVSKPDNVPTPDLAKAYIQIENLYKEAQNTKKPEDYIAHWVNFYRLEKNLFPTLISSMADYMIEKNLNVIPINSEQISNIFHTHIYKKPFYQYFIYALEKPTELNILIDTYAIINYNKWIPYLFDINVIEEFSNYILQSRFDENEIIVLVKSKIKEYLEKTNIEINNKDTMQSFFLHFVKKDEFYKNETLYEFCKNSYPIIETHTPISVKQGLLKRISYTKIKRIREITELLTPYKDLKNYITGYVD